MARIELINICATLRGGERATSGSSGGRSSTFSIRDLDLSVFDGETLVILGPSGCGKTTLLKIIAGLIAPDSGDVHYDGMSMNAVPPGSRRVGMVFENYALYAHLTSRTNVVSYFLFRKKTPELSALARDKYRRTSELMGVELESLMDRRPTTLSGGEKQRVALGRCITREPAFFLRDEPFSNLDQALRERYRVNLKILLKQFSITSVYVTHDHVEALILADRLAIMDRGRIEQVGTYQEIYEQPRSVFVAGFLNRHVGTPPISLIDARYLASGGPLGDVQVGIRPEDVVVSRDDRPDGVAGIVAGKLSLPMLNATVLSVRVDQHEIFAHIGGDENVRAGDRVWLTFRKYHLFDSPSGRRLGSHAEPAPA